MLVFTNSYSYICKKYKKMIKYIIHTADIHIRNMRRHDEAIEQLSKFIQECKNFTSEHDPSETRIVVCGDIAHQKINISCEQQLMISWFFKELDKITKTIIIAGNHDFLMNNKDRIDALTPVFKMNKFKQTVYADKVLGYKSGCIIDENVIWALYSSFENFTHPDIEAIKNENPECNKVIGLYHGDVIGSKTDSGRISDMGLNGDAFNGCDIVLAGHIHKRQEIKKKGIPIVYAGSLIQQDNNENVTGHGYVLWNLEDETHEDKDIPSEYGYYKFSIKSIDDIDEDKERLLNL